jgi:hypothetical protein
MNPFSIYGLAECTATLGVCAAGFRFIPRLPTNVKRLREATSDGFDGLLATNYLIAPGVSFNEDGSFTTGFRVRGRDAQTMTEGGLARMVGDFNAAVSCVDVGWMFEFIRSRYPEEVLEPYGYAASATHMVLRDARRLECWEDEGVLLITYLPAQGASRALARWLVKGGWEQSAPNEITDGLRALETGCRMIETMLRTCMLEVDRLGRIPGEYPECHDGLVDVLYGNANGRTLTSVSLFDEDLDAAGLFVSPLALRPIIAVQEFDGGLDIKYGPEHIRCISLAEFPASSQPRLTAALASLGIPHRDHSRLIVASNEEMSRELAVRFNDAQDDATPVELFAEKGGPSTVSGVEIAKRRIKKDALTRMDQIQEVLEKHQNGSRKHSWYSRTIEVRHRDLAQVKQWQDAICETLRTVPGGGFGTRVETRRAAEVWLSTLGANGECNVGRTPMHGVTVGDLANLTDAWRGRAKITCDKCPPNVRPMAIVRRADTLTRFSLDLHQGDGMATIVVGMKGRGKSSLVDFIIGHFQQTPADRVIAIDYLRTEERTITMLGGAYGVIGEARSKARFCPFVNLGTPEGRALAAEWCEGILKLDTMVTGDLMDRVTEAIDYMAGDPDWFDHACVSIFMQKLSAKPAVKNLFAAYAEGGIYGFFDATPAEMKTWHRAIRGYDLSLLLNMSERALFPALHVLYTDVESELDGRRTMLVIEEAHLPLKNPHMASKIVDWVRTTRKKHLAIVLVLTDLNGISSDILKALKSQTDTVFATENPNANSDRKAYKSLGFDDKHIDSLIPSRNPSVRRDGIEPLRFPYLQLGEDGVAPFVLDLSPAEMEVYTKSTDDDKRVTAKALRAPYPPAAVFDAVGLDEEAQSWEYYDETKFAAHVVASDDNLADEHTAYALT